MPGTRALVIGLDMGDGSLIRHWAGRGQLPHLGAMIGGGAWIDLESTADVLHTSTWPTFATGTLPGRHGVYYPYQPKPGHQMARHIQPDQYGEPTFWKVADAAGRRCVVFDIPETFPEASFGGRAIFDWGTWAWYGTPASLPAALLSDVKNRFGPYPLGYEAKRLGLAQPDDIEARLLRSIHYKSQTVRSLIAGDDWDLAVVGFCETHPAGHYLWPAGAERVDDASDDAFGPLSRIYAAIDHAIGELRAALPPDCLVLIASGDGVRPNRSGWHLLPGILTRLGYTCAPGTAAGGPPPSRSLLNRAQGLVPAAVKQRIAMALPWWLRDELGMRAQAGSIDWTRTRAFTLPTDLEGCIRINLAGREPAGIVEPGPAYARLCEEIRGCLEELVNPATGERAVHRVWVRDEVFPGPRQEHLPDLMVTWNDAAPLTAVTSARAGLIEGVNPDPRPGTHSRDGFLLAEGRSVQPALRGHGRLVDVAPTVMRMLGLELPGVDGRPIDLQEDTRRQKDESWTFCT